MPKRISVKDKTTIYYALKIGEIDGIAHFAEVQPLECQFTTHTGVKSVYSYGTILNYNATAIIEYNESTRYINEFTRFWVGSCPDDSTKVNDYTVVRVGEPHNGLFTVYLASVTQNAQNIWYAYHDRILLADVKIEKDDDGWYVIVPKNQFLPIWYDTKVWYREPSDLETLEYGLHLVDISEEEHFTKFHLVEGLYQDG